MKIKIAAPLALMLLAGCSKPPPAQKNETKPSAAPAPKITSLYPSPGRISKGESAEICYGVDGATAVALQPPVEKVWPALSRCFEVHPAATTEYTLTATDEQGRSDRKSVMIQVGPAKEAGPHLIEVRVNKLQVAAGEPVTVCYIARNATSVRITPGTAAGALGPERGCVTDTPRATTTYQVVATGAGGQTDSERVTVKVR